MNDPYFDTNYCVRRLFNQWLKNPRLIIAVDFDDTVFNFHKTPNQTHEQVLEALRLANELNFYVVIYTAAKPDRWQFMKEYLNSQGVQISGINEFPFEGFPLDNSKSGAKLFYNLLLDDRAGLWQAYTILMTLIREIKEHIIIKQ